jgi:hypothetical protein
MGPRLCDLQYTSSGSRHSSNSSPTALPPLKCSPTNDASCTSRPQPPDLQALHDAFATSTGPSLAALPSPLLGDVFLPIPNPDFVSSQEHGGRQSSRDGEGKSDYTDEDEDKVVMQRGGLEDLLRWPPELLHRPPMRRLTRKTKDQGRQEGVGDVEVGRMKNQTEAPLAGRAREDDWVPPSISWAAVAEERYSAEGGPRLYMGPGATSHGCQNEVGLGWRAPHVDVGQDESWGTHGVMGLGEMMGWAGFLGWVEMVH